MDRMVLVKPPEISRFNFGAFSLGVLAAAVRHLARISILDATDLSIEEATCAVWGLDPDWVGVTVMGLHSVPPITAFIKNLKATMPKRGARRRIALLAGGHGASMLPDPLLRAGADAVIIGEGEQTLQQILGRGLGSDLPGLVRREGEKVKPQPPIRPLDRLSPPARDLMPAPTDGVHLMETSRGCPHACGFCETTRFYGRHWRPLSPDRVDDEIKRLVEQFDAWIIHFADDNFAADPQRVLEICRRIQRGPMPVLFLASARGDDLVADPRLIPAMAAARILRVTVGIETLEQEVADRVGKQISPETYREAFSRMRSYGIFSTASLIVGLPGETAEMRKRAVDKVIEAGPDSARFLPFWRLPGVPLANLCSVSDADPDDVRDAWDCTEAFFRHPVVRARLSEASATPGVRGLLARAVLEGHVDIESYD
jgi:anaerobic magnesium-protoporphyrin IX monomethyl ester cyclase